MSEQKTRQIGTIPGHGLKFMLIPPPQQSLINGSIHYINQHFSFILIIVSSWNGVSKDAFVPHNRVKLFLTSAILLFPFQKLYSKFTLLHSLYLSVYGHLSFYNNHTDKDDRCLDLWRNLDLWSNLFNFFNESKLIIFFISQRTKELGFSRSTSRCFSLSRLLLRDIKAQINNLSFLLSSSKPMQSDHSFRFCPWMLIRLSTANLE